MTHTMLMKVTEVNTYTPPHIIK